MAFVPEAALIALREGLEALLITGILLTLVVKLGRPDAKKHIWLGFALAVAASVVAGWLIQRFVLDAFEEGGGAEWFELVAVAVAVVILTYMVFWMWKHTRALMATMREQVAALLTRGAMMGIVLLTFASVIREGIEVVLFYGALASRATPFELAWSGLVGFVASAAIVGLIITGARRFDLQRFFAVTGILLVFVAAGLLVHGVSAAMGLGVIPPAPSVWDTSDAIPDDSATGRVLHAVVGYAATPTLLQALLYFGYVFGVGGAYLWTMGAFHRRDASARRLRPTRVGVAAIALLVAVGFVANGAANPGAIVSGHEHGDDDAHEGVSLASIPEGDRIGILLRSHGEPQHYNETTYASFAAFMRDLLTTLGMEQLLAADQGTVLIDKAHPYDASPRLPTDASLMDAWTNDAAVPALPLGPVVALAGASAPVYEGFYVQPGGPGLGEPDILEAAGLDAWRTWLAMENDSPMHRTKGAMLDAAQRMLEARYGDAVVVRQAFHIVPHVGPDESIESAAAAFVDADVSLIVDAYTSSVASDVMDACMMRPHLHHALDEAGFTGKLVHAEQAGLTHAYWHAAAGRVRELLATLPADAVPAVFLTHHGQTPGSTSPCGTGEDQYHANAAALYAGTTMALAEELAGRDVLTFQVYGQGADAADDGVLDAMEALAKAREAGATHVIDLPFELTGDGMDNLVMQRAGYGLLPQDGPHHDAAGETRLTRDGVNVLIASGAYAPEARAAALVEVVEAALAEAMGGASAEGDGHDHARRGTSQPS